MTDEQIRQIIIADHERLIQSEELALKESGWYPGDGAHMVDVLRYVRRVNRLQRRIFKRLN